MPKVKKQKADTSDSDSGPDDRGPLKKSKVDNKTEPSKTKAGRSSEEENTWDLGKNRFVKLTEFKGKWYVNIREFFMSNEGELRPGKKGIMLTMEQWQKFKNAIPDIEDAVKRNV